MLNPARHEKSLRRASEKLSTEDWKWLEEIAAVVEDEFRACGWESNYYAATTMCKWLNEKRDLRTSSRLIPLMDDLTHILVEGGQEQTALKARGLARSRQTD
jgi:hypothetical protein